MKVPKHVYPFRLGTTSFIYPADYITNARQLSSRVDEVELLLFESHRDSLPTEQEIHQLADLAATASISYNIHLPLDLHLADKDMNCQERAARRLADIICLVAPLNPTTHTLHLALAPSDGNGDAVAAWQHRATTGVRKFLALSQIPSRLLSIETLEYPPNWFFPIVEELDLAVCLDVGHVLRYGFDLNGVLSEFRQRISILHLHGMAQGKDHLSLNRLDQQAWRTLIPFLIQFRGSVSLEVFSLDRFNLSMIHLAKILSV